MKDLTGPRERAETEICFCRNLEQAESPAPLPAQIPPDAASLFQRLAHYDPASARHALRVCRLACRLAADLDLPGEARRHLFLAAWLHDIGKIFLPLETLHKPGPLSAEERLRVQEHPVLGEHLVARIVREREVRSAIRSHHERWDGTGYPDGLHGGRIPLLARILTIADTFDAMTSPRPYRAELSPEEALHALREAAGTQLDPGLTRVFRRAVKAMRRVGSRV